MSKNNGTTFTPMEYNFPQKKESQGILKAIYNSEEGTYFGRTLESWAKIIFFYIIFYIVLAAFVSICMQGLLATLNDDEPMWKLNKSLIGTNPGLGYRPLGAEAERGAIIQFDTKKIQEGEQWIKALDEFLQPYNESVGMKRKPCHFNETYPKGQVCAVEMDKFGPCSPQNHYGYKNGSPCIFLKLNKIYDWEPIYYDNIKDLPDIMPPELKSHIESTDQLERQQIWISCNGYRAHDKENDGVMKFYPGPGFPAYYYPYINQKNYLSPLVAVQFLNVSLNQMVTFECRAWAHNIIYSGSMRERQGSVAFQIFMD